MNSLSSCESAALELRGISFFGRRFSEYVRFFSLDPDRLRGRRVLDVAAGPSSFTAEACALGIDAVAMDPLYGYRPDALAQHVAIDYAKMTAQMREKTELFRFRSFSSLEDAEADRRRAAQRFLQDYAEHFVHGRYRCGALPELPADDGAFDIVLCAHLLFVYERMFDFDFHVAACRELMRVSRGDVRIHPLVGLNGKRYARLAELCETLAAEGIASEIVDVDYEFFAGTTETLVLKRS
jgi:2-polyprenyl-3-methyl-5-hydroxy-6-metoxy-1,4-benzoquinol methylase